MSCARGGLPLGWGRGGPKGMALMCDCSIHNLGLVGHIEDIAVARDQQGKKLGLRIIQALDHVAEKVGCYKVSDPVEDIERAVAMLTAISKAILDCSEANEGFYVKCGYKRAGLEMAHYY